MRKLILIVVVFGTILFSLGRWVEHNTNDLNEDIGGYVGRNYDVED